MSVATDVYRSNAYGMNYPADGAFAIVPSDTNELAQVTRAIYVGGAGNIRVLMANGNEVTFSNLSAGTLYPFRLRKVFATGGTSVSLLIGVT